VKRIKFILILKSYRNDDFLRRQNDFAEVSINLVRHRFKDKFCWIIYMYIYIKIIIQNILTNKTSTFFALLIMFEFSTQIFW